MNPEILDNFIKTSKYGLVCPCWAGFIRSTEIMNVFEWLTEDGIINVTSENMERLTV